MVALFETVPLSPLHYINIELCKICSFKAAKGNFECQMLISPAAQIEVPWWRDNIYTSYRNLEKMTITDTVK